MELEELGELMQLCWFDGWLNSNELVGCLAYGSMAKHKGELERQGMKDAMLEEACGAWCIRVTKGRCEVHSKMDMEGKGRRMTCWNKLGDLGVPKVPSA